MYCKADSVIPSTPFPPPLNHSEATRGIDAPRKQGKGGAWLVKSQVYYILHISDWFGNLNLGQPEYGLLLEAGTDFKRGNDPT